MLVFMAGISMECYVLYSETLRAKRYGHDYDMVGFAIISMRL